MTRRSNRPDSPSRTRRGFAFGALWGIGTSANEALLVPFGPLASIPAVGVIAQVTLVYCVAGVLIACTTLAVEPRLDRTWKVVALIVGAAAATSALNLGSWALTDALGDLTGFRRVLGTSGFSGSIGLHAFWVALIHGGLLIVACVLVARMDRTRRVLGDAQVSRNRTEALLDKAQIEALYGHVQPAFLLRAMCAVRDRYAATDIAAADRLLDELVAFLRRAMPSVRSGTSTLFAEVMLARRYAHIRQAIDPTAPLWRVEAELPLPDLPFPPLVLLPVLDALAASGTAQALTLCARHDARAQRVTITVTVAGGAGPAAALRASNHYHVRVALQAALGDDWCLSLSPNGSAAHVLTLELGARLPGPVHLAPAAPTPPSIDLAPTHQRSTPFPVLRAP